MSRALVCTVIGAKYERMYRAVKAQFEAYAARCSADHHVIRQPLDETGLHSILTQKMLVPSRFRRYDEVAHLDIDVLIPRSAADIFSCLPLDAAFSAAPDPRGTPAYERAWNFAPFTKQSHEEYYAGKQLASSRPLFSVNGGALLFRTSRSADLFASWYFDRERYAGKDDSYYHNEEDPMAFLTQANGTFFPLPCRFNRQVIYALCETEEGLHARQEITSTTNRALRRVARALRGYNTASPNMRRYRTYLELLLRAGDILHFSASYPIPRVSAELLIG